MLEDTCLFTIILELNYCFLMNARLVGWKMDEWTERQMGGKMDN